MAVAPTKPSRSDEGSATHRPTLRVGHRPVPAGRGVVVDDSSRFGHHIRRPRRPVGGELAGPGIRHVSGNVGDHGRRARREAGCRLCGQRRHKRARRRHRHRSCRVGTGRAVPRLIGPGGCRPPRRPPCRGNRLVVLRARGVREARSGWHRSGEIRGGGLRTRDGSGAVRAVRGTVRRRRWLGIRESRTARPPVGVPAAPAWAPWST